MLGIFPDIAIALRWSILTGYENIARFLIKSGAHDVRDDDGRYAMHVAAACGRVISPGLLEDLTTSPDVSDSHGKTTFHLAAENGHVDVLRQLLETDRIMNTSDRPKSASTSYIPSYTPHSQRLANEGTTRHSLMASLSSLTLWGKSSSQTSLLEPFVQRRDNGGRNALELAVIGGHVDATDFLLDKVYSYKIRDTETNSKGENVAQLAAKHGHVGILQLLAKHKVNLSLRNSEGHTPLQVATSEGKFGAMAELGFSQNQITVPPVKSPHNTIKYDQFYFNAISEID